MLFAIACLCCWYLGRIRACRYTADDALGSGAAPPTLGTSPPSADAAADATAAAAATAPMLQKLGGSSRPKLSEVGGVVSSQPTAQAAGAQSQMTPSKVSHI